MVNLAEAGEFSFFAGPIGADPFAEVGAVKQVHHAFEVLFLGFGIFPSFTLECSLGGVFLFHEAIPAVRREIYGAGVLRTVTQAREFEGDFAELFPTFTGAFNGGQVVRVLDKFGGENAGEAFAKVFVVFLGVDVVGALDHPTCVGLSFLVAKPIGVTTFAPLREVLLEDGLASEVSVQDAVNRGKRVEPGEDFGTLLAVLQAMVELVAELFWEPRDFAGTSFHRIFLPQRQRERRGFEISKWVALRAPRRCSVRAPFIWSGFNTARV